MDPLIGYLILVGVFVLIALGGTLLLKLRKPETPSDAGQTALLENLQAQLKELKNTNAELASKLSQATEKAAGVEATLKVTRETAEKAEQKHEADLAQARADAEAALAKAEQQYQKNLAELNLAFEKKSHEVLKAMAPDVTKEVTVKVDPLIAQIKTALTEYRDAINTKFTVQNDALVQVKEQMEGLRTTSKSLADSTNDFTSVLKSASHRGKWGEQTLRRVIEAAGLNLHCDFAEQVSHDDARPDLIIKLPNKRCIIVDSKVPEFDLPSTGASEPDRRSFAENHAKKLKETIKALAKRNYAETLSDLELKPFDQVILFLPAESLLSTALEGNRDFILEAQAEKILLATPATLIGFLSAINLAWQQNQQAENAAAIAQETNELYKRIAKFVEHIVKIRKDLESASKAMNQAIGSYERMVLPQSEKVKKLGIAPNVEALPEIDPVETTIRELGS